MVEKNKKELDIGVLGDVVKLADKLLGGKVLCGSQLT